MAEDDRKGPASDRRSKMQFAREMLSDNSADALVRASRSLKEAIESPDPALGVGIGQRFPEPDADLADYHEALAAELREGIGLDPSRAQAPPSLFSKRGSVVPAWGSAGLPVSPLHFGHNTVWVRDGLGLWDRAAAAPDAQALELIRRLGPNILRFPGGTRAMRYHFDQAIGPRRIAQCDPYTGASDGTPYGLDEFLRMARSLGAEVTLVSPWVEGSPQEAAALVAYVNARPDSTVAIGSDSRRDWGTAGDWARLRTENGHPEPYGVKFLEIGNEQYLTLGTPPATSCGRPSKFVQCERWEGNTRILTTARDHAEQVAITGRLVRQVDPLIKIGASAFSPAILIGETGINGSNALDASSLLDADNDPWNRRLASEAGDFFDFFVLHPYDLQRKPLGVIAPVDPANLAENLARTIEELRSIAPSKEIAITEFGYLFRGGGMLGALLAAHIIRVSIEKGALMALRHILIEDQGPASDPLSEVGLNLREPFANNAAIAGPGRITMPGYQAMALLRSSLSGGFVTASTDVPGLIAFGTLDAGADRLAVVLARSQPVGVNWTASVWLPPGTWDAQASTIFAPRLYSPYDRVDYDRATFHGLTGSHEVTIPAHALVVIQYRRSAPVVVAEAAALRSAPAAIPVEASPPEADETIARRHRLLTALQGRRIDQAYLLDPDLRRDIEAEAASGLPDALVTREMIATISDLIRQGRQQSAQVPTLASAPSAFSGSLRTPARPGPGVGTPTVVIVPGLLGSSLSDTTIFPFGYGWIWANPRAIVLDELPELALGPYAGGSESDADPSVEIEPTGALQIFYDLLYARLALEGYDVRLFPFDWRRDAGSGPVAARLAAAIADLYQTGGAPVSIVAHSQGSIASRSAIQALRAGGLDQAVGQLILLGPAHFGSFSAALALAGTHELVKILSSLGFSDASGLTGALQTMSGLYQLLPFDPVRVPFLAAPGNDLGRPGFWSVPIDQARLSTFFGWARGLDTTFLNDRTTVILGDNNGSPTASGVGFVVGALTVTGEDLRGDGTVLHSCSVLSGTKTYLAEGVEHSQMANSAKVIQAVVALLAGDPVDLPAYPSDPAAVAPPWPPLMP